MKLKILMLVSITDAKMIMIMMVRTFHSETDHKGIDSVILRNNISCHLRLAEYMQLLFLLCAW